MKRWWQALATALVVTGGGIAINIATESAGNALAWVAVGVATLASAGLALWTGRDEGTRRGAAEDSPTGTGEPGHPSTQSSIHGDVSGSVVQAHTIKGGVSFGSPPRSVHQHAEAGGNSVIQQAGGDIIDNRRGDDVR